MVTIFHFYAEAKTVNFTPHQMYLNVIEEMLLFVHLNFQKSFSKLTTRRNSVPSRELT